MPPPFIAATRTYNGSAESNLSANITAATPAGATLVAICATQNSANLPTGITDAGGNVYTAEPGNIGTPAPAFIAYRADGATGGPGGGPTAANGTGAGNPFTSLWPGTAGQRSAVLVCIPDATALQAAPAVAVGSAVTQITATGTPTAGGALALAAAVVAQTAGDPDIPAGYNDLGGAQIGTGPYMRLAFANLASGTQGAAQSPTFGPWEVAANARASLYLFTVSAGWTPPPPPAPVILTDALPGGAQGEPYRQLLNVRAREPYQTRVSAGALPAGLTLGTGARFGRVAANTGPQGNPAQSQLAATAPLLGPVGAQKLFAGSSGNLPASFMTAPGGGSNVSGAHVVNTIGNGALVFQGYTNPATQSAMNAYVDSIPAEVGAAGLYWVNEPEHGKFNSGAEYVAGYLAEMEKWKAAQERTPVLLLALTAHYTDWYRQGGDNSYIPPSSTEHPGGADWYLIDYYDRAAYAQGGQHFGTQTGWLAFLSYTVPKGHPVGLGEFGISGYNDEASQLARLQADLAYIRGAFGPGGSVTAIPMPLILYWHTAGTETGYPSPSDTGTLNNMRGPAVMAAWQDLAREAAGAITGTPA